MPSAADRLKAIVNDNRALFLPITCDEKNESLALLDYVDLPDHHPGDTPNHFVGTPEHLGGVHDKLAEVYDRQKSLKGIKVAGLAVQSILFEYADFYNGHAESARDLTVLDSRLRDFRNQAGVLSEVAEAHGDSETGMVAFVRTLDIAAVKDRGRKRRSEPPFDPLQTATLRGHTGVDGKNKTIVSRYDNPDDRKRDLIDGHVEKTIDNYTVADALNIMPNVQRNAQNGMLFWGRILRSRFIEYQPHADNAIASIDLKA